MQLTLSLRKQPIPHDLHLAVADACEEFAAAFQAGVVGGGSLAASRRFTQARERLAEAYARCYGREPG